MKAYTKRILPKFKGSHEITFHGYKSYHYLRAKHSLYKILAGRIDQKRTSVRVRNIKMPC